MKNNANQIPFDSEPCVLACFEKFFIFEFYVRYLRIKRSQDLQKILDLKELIRNKFVESDVMSALSDCKFSFEDTPDITYPIDIKLEDLINWTLNAIQFSECRLDHLSDELDSIELQKELVDKLFEPFNDLNDSIDLSQKRLCFLFSDLTEPNDIYFIFKWWSKNTKAYHRDENNMVGKYGVISIEEDDGEGGKVYEIVGLPFNSPRIIVRKDNYDIYHSDHDSVRINGNPLSKSLVLSINFDSDAKNFNRIINEFTNTFELVQSSWYCNQLDSGVLPNFDLNSSSNSIKNKSKQGYVLIKTHKPISKYLIGLMCYDLIKENHSMPDAAKAIEVKIARIKPHKANVITQYYYDTEKLITTIDEIIRKKFPGENIIL